MREGRSVGEGNDRGGTKGDETRSLKEGTKGEEGAGDQYRFLLFKGCRAGAFVGRSQRRVRGGRDRRKGGKQDDPQRPSRAAMRPMQGKWR